MAQQTWSGPFVFNRDTINRMVEPNRIGAYVLLRYDDQSTPWYYVGRSDTDLQRRLLQHLDNGEPYSKFWFRYETCVRDAFFAECYAWHDYKDNGTNLDNTIHPDTPSGSVRIHCPVCNG